MTFDADTGQGEPPVLRERLRVFTLDVHAVPVLSGSAFDRDRPPRIDRVSGPPQKRSCDAAIRREGNDATRFCDRLTGVAADQYPLANLAFELDDVKDVLVGR